MKNLISFFLVLLCANCGFSQEDSNPSPDIFIHGNISYSYIIDFESPIAYGLGTEAKINERFSVGGTFNYGTSNSHRQIHVNPNLKFYPKSVFRGFFLTSGISFNQLKSKDDISPIGFPFDEDRGSDVSFFSLNVGLGVSTLVKDRWSIGFAVTLAGPLDIDLDSPILDSNFTVGYGF